MSEQNLVLGEKFSHKISAEYHSQESAAQAVQLLVEKAHIPRAQINIIKPHDPLIARKLEPEVTGIRRTLVKSHLVFGGIGLALGVLVSIILTTVGPVFTQSSPLFTFIAVIFLTTALALMLAGLVSLRPDHDPLIAKARSAADTDRWTVIAHCISQEQQTRATEAVNYSAQTL